MYKHFFAYTLIILTYSVASKLNAQAKYTEVYFPDDTIKYEVIYKSTDSLGEGKLVAYFKESPYQEAFVKNYYYGKQSGVYKAFYPSGKTMIFAVYRAGVRHGDWAYYGTDGTVREKAMYQNGKLHGFYINRIENYQGRYKNGLKHGKWEYNLKTPAYRKEYYEKGKLTSKPTVIDRLKNIVISDQDTSQTIEGKPAKLQIKKHDTLFLPEKGTEELKQYTITYKSRDSIPHPTLHMAMFDINKNQAAVVKYIYQGKLNGIYKIYYPNGNTYRSAHYDMGKLDGEWREYRPDGKLHIRGRYKAGKKHGRWMINVGTPEYRKEKYKNGVLK